MQRFPVEYVLYGFLYISFALLLYNLAYIGGERRRERRLHRRRKKWLAQLPPALDHARAAAEPDPAHGRRLFRKLRRVMGLMAYCEAAEEMQRARPGDWAAYVARYHSVFTALAAEYTKRESMERAYYAWFLYELNMIGPAHSALISILYGYLPNSTVYCRENVFKAIFRAGNIAAVERVLQLLHDGRIFHSGKLLSDALLAFPGDQTLLAATLWRHRKQWSGAMVCAVVDFITRMEPEADLDRLFRAAAQSATPHLRAAIRRCYAENPEGVTGFGPIFLGALEDADLHLEIKLAMLRYLARHPYPPAKSLLLRYVLGEEQAELAIVAAFALKSYPGKDTEQALRQALKSGNWHVRSNAAASLIAITENLADLKDIARLDDRYAKEMLAYHLMKLKAAKEGSACIPS